MSEFRMTFELLVIFSSDRWINRFCHSIILSKFALTYLLQRNAVNGYILPNKRHALSSSETNFPSLTIQYQIDVHFKMCVNYYYY